ncbi:methyl-CpG-binding domain-containing protein 6-like [Senna tora]|uniref:Methyl-CpG-binding domain-containing protein 6-like n=1 Tax=Senna tora TaxID=362788 RepID=A0A834XLN3_9FABA|nr:methyl-CpG-binding domain-containing protein 6-like [Senna tora]
MSNSLEKKMKLDYGSHALHNELSLILKGMVTESLSGMKPPKQNLEFPYNFQRERLMRGVANRRHKLGERKRGRPTTSIVVKEITIAFELPKHSIARVLDMDKHEEGDIIPAPKFSFKERLEGWRIECRQRVSNSNICDTFYRHIKSERCFRSILEVVKFLLYETYYYPKKPTTKPTVLADIHQDTNMMIADASAMVKGETIPTFVGNDKEEQEEMKNPNKGTQESTERVGDVQYNNDLHNIILQKGKTIRMMNTEEEKGSYDDANKKARREEVAADYEVDEVLAAEVLMNLKTPRMHKDVHKQQEMNSRVPESDDQIRISKLAYNFFYDLKNQLPLGGSK